MKPLYIFDLDGTLALIEHRRHFVEYPSAKCFDCGGKNRRNCVQCGDLDEGFSPDWPAFFSACDKDARNDPIIYLMHEILRSGCEVWIFSGRSDEVREKTEKWLRDNTLYLVAMKPENIMMREAGDFTPDDVLKKQWLDAMLPADRERLVAVFDDRDRVVKMWRDNGIACLQVAQGNF